MKSRIRILLENCIASLFTRASNIIITLLLVPISINALGIEQYGLVAVLLSFSILFNFSDLGLGTAFVKAFSGIKDQSDRIDALKIISQSWFFLIFFSTISILISLILYILGVYNNINIFIVMALIFLNIPFSIYQRILFALQKNLVAGVWQTGGKLLSLALIFILSIIDNITIRSYLLVFFGIPLIINIIGSVVIFKKTELIPNKKYFSFSGLYGVVRVGFLFLVLQLVPFLETGIDNIILSVKYSYDFIGTYDIYLKLFLYISAFISIFTFPLWPAVSKALAEQDFQWINKIKKNIYMLTLIISGLLSVVMFFLVKKIVYLWTGNYFYLNNEIIFMFSVVVFLYCLSIVQGMFLNGFGLISEQVYFYFFYLTLMVILKFILVFYFSIYYMLVLVCIFMLIRLFYMERVIKSYLIRENLL